MIMRLIKSILSGVNAYYIKGIKRDYEKRMDRPVRAMISDWIKALSIVFVILILFAVESPALKSLVDYTIENMTTYRSQISDLSTQIDSAKEDMIGAALRTVKQFKNPTFKGIRCCNIGEVLSVYPSHCSMEEKIVYYHLSKWASSEGYDGVIFGESYSGLNGTFYWSDGGNEFDTDFELIINMLKEKGCKKIMSFVSNPELRVLTPDVTNYLTGTFIESEVQHSMISLFNHKIWKTYKGIVIRSNNFTAEIVDNKVNIISRPNGRDNVTVVYNKCKNSFIKDIKDGSLSAVEKVKKCF